MPAKIELSDGQSKAVVSSLLAAGEKDKKIAGLEFKAEYLGWASAMLADFLVSNHPELTSELAAFVIKNVEDGGYDFGVGAEAGLNAIEYHVESIENDDIDAAHEKLRAIQREEAAIRIHHQNNTKQEAVQMNPKVNVNIDDAELIISNLSDSVRAANKEADKYHDMNERSSTMKYRQVALLARIFSRQDDSAIASLIAGIKSELEQLRSGKQDDDTQLSIDSIIDMVGTMIDHSTEDASSLYMQEALSQLERQLQLEREQPTDH